MRTLWFVWQTIELYPIFGEWGFWFSRLIKLAEDSLLNSLYNLLVIHLAGFSAKNKEIEPDEQPLQE